MEFDIFEMMAEWFDGKSIYETQFAFYGIALAPLFHIGQ